MKKRIYDVKGLTQEEYNYLKQAVSYYLCETYLRLDLNRKGIQQKKTRDDLIQKIKKSTYRLKELKRCP